MKFLDELTYDSKAFNPPSAVLSPMLSKTGTKPRGEQKENNKIRIYHFFPDVFSVTFAIVHHGSTWLTKTNHSQHRNNPEATHYDHKVLAFPIRTINQKSQRQYTGSYSSINANFIRPCREHRKPMLTYNEYRVNCRDHDP